jgi:hypothetical protein
MNRRHSFGEKLKEIVIEIFIIVFAVTLSIWFHNWSDHRHEQKEAIEFLRGLKDDLNEDIKLIETNKNIVTRLDSNFHFILALKKPGADTITDTVIAPHLAFFLRVTRPNIGRYEGFKSSGKIGTIENDSLKEDILAYYHQTMPHLAYGEDYVNSLQTKILDLLIDSNDKMSVRDFVMSGKMKSLFNLGIHNFEVNIEDYGKLIKQAQKIIAEIDQELKK